MIATQSRQKYTSRPSALPDVEQDDERQPRRFGVRLCRDDLVPAEEGGKQDDVPEARDREQLAHALQDAEDDRLEPAQMQVDRGVAATRSTWWAPGTSRS